MLRSLGTRRDRCWERGVSGAFGGQHCVAHRLSLPQSQATLFGVVRGSLLTLSPPSFTFILTFWGSWNKIQTLPRPVGPYLAWLLPSPLLPSPLLPFSPLLTMFQPHWPPLCSGKLTSPASRPLLLRLSRRLSAQHLPWLAPYSLGLSSNGLSLERLSLMPPKVPPSCHSSAVFTV